MLQNQIFNKIKSDNIKKCCKIKYLIKSDLII